MASKATFVSNYRQAVAQLIAVMDTLRGLKRQYDTEGFSGTFVAGDLTAANADLAPADIGAAVGSAQAIDDFATSGFHWSNLEKMKP